MDYPLSIDRGRVRHRQVRGDRLLPRILLCSIAALLRASHIKPWAKSSNPDRLNPANGILLTAHIDALFDCGFISFADDGTMLVSAQIAEVSSSKRHRTALTRSCYGRITNFLLAGYRSQPRDDPAQSPEEIE
jgi:hypothetical protein